MQNATFANIIGPDVNQFRGQVNYALVASRTNYCYLRGSSSGTGRFRVDTMFYEYVRGFREVGVLTGAYHYAVPSADLTTADSQCDDFIRILQEGYGPGNYGDLFPVVDIETPQDKSISTDTLLDWTDRFRRRFESRTRRRLMIYTGIFFIQLYNNFYHSTKGFILSNMPLWIAMYKEIPSNPPFPPDAGGWTRWRLWQYSESGTFPGVNPPVDLNYGPTSIDWLKPPAVVRNFRAYPRGNEIVLTWDANRDEDLNGYNIFINSNYVTTLNKNATTYTFKFAKKPLPTDRYEMSIEAFDLDGDFSPRRATAQVRYRDFDLKNDFGEDSMIKTDVKQDNTQERSKFGKPISRNEYKDPVDYLEDKFVKKSKFLEYNAREEELEFQNFEIDGLDYDNFLDFNDNDKFSPSKNNFEVNPYSNYREFQNKFESSNVKPVFKYYLEEENENDDFEDFDDENYEDVFNSNSYTGREEEYELDFYQYKDNDDFDRDDFQFEDYNIEENPVYNADDYLNHYDEGNTANFGDYDLRFEDYSWNPRNNENLSEQNNNHKEESDFLNLNPTIVDKINAFDIHEDEVNSFKEDMEETVHSDSPKINYIQENEFRRQMENQLDFRNKKCKKCKKHKKSKKPCYGCKHNIYGYGLEAHNHDEHHDHSDKHHGHHHDHHKVHDYDNLHDDYLYHPDYHHKSKKKNKNHRN
jgi:GH25 family lysozyme M1 (1,4-beta-N-acetylmuramidase)